MKKILYLAMLPAVFLFVLTVNWSRAAYFGQKPNVTVGPNGSAMQEAKVVLSGEAKAYVQVYCNSLSSGDPCNIDIPDSCLKTCSNKEVFSYDLYNTTYQINNGSVDNMSGGISRCGQEEDDCVEKQSFSLPSAASVLRAGQSTVRIFTDDSSKRTDDSWAGANIVVPGGNLNTSKSSPAIGEDYTISTSDLTSGIKASECNIYRKGPDQSGYQLWQSGKISATDSQNSVGTYSYKISCKPSVSGSELGSVTRNLIDVNVASVTVGGPPPEAKGTIKIYVSGPAGVTGSWDFSGAGGISGAENCGSSADWNMTAGGVWICDNGVGLENGQRAVTVNPHDLGGYTKSISSPQTQTITDTNDGVWTITYTAAGGGTYYSCDGSSCVSDPEGEYTGASCLGECGQTGSIHVRHNLTNLPSNWTVSKTRGSWGPKSGSGNDQNYSNVPSGTYKISWPDVAGYTLASIQCTETKRSGGTASCATDQKGSINSRYSDITFEATYIQGGGGCVGDQVNGDDACFISQNVPASVAPGAQFAASITMKNIGTRTWTPAPQLQNGYMLGSQNPENNWNWGVNRVSVPNAITSGSLADFVFNVIAPATQGTYNFQWKMVQDAHDTPAWFGGLTENLAINVAAGSACNWNGAQDNGETGIDCGGGGCPTCSQEGENAQFISQTVPSEVCVNESFVTPIRMKNTGATTWTGQGEGDYRLEIPDHNTTWSYVVEYLGGDTVAPGQEYTFNFDAKAPAVAGTYSYFSRQMVRNKWYGFGEKTPNVLVTVKDSGTCGGGGAVCGNGTCEAGETAASCPQDCGGIQGGGEGGGGYGNPETACSNGADDDANGQTDCADTTCQGTVVCGSFTGECSMSANPEKIIKTPFGNPGSLLSWSCAGATGCQIDNGVGPVDAVGGKQVYPESTTTYNLACNEAGAQATVFVRVYNWLLKEIRPQ